ncbi:MAG: PAS domain S-box protein [Bacteroidia bacterium]
MENLHRLLKRQVSKFLSEEQQKDPAVISLVEAINAAYKSYDTDYEQLERTLEISSNELFKSNESLNALNIDLEAKINSRTSELEAANQILLVEKEVRERHEAEQAMMESLLEASNKAINKLILCDNIKEAFHEIFKEIIETGHISEVFFCLRENSHKSQKKFNLLGNLSSSGTMNEELFERLCYVLNNHLPKIKNVLLRNEPLFLRQIEDIVDTELASKNEGEFKNLICPVVVRGQIHSVVVFSSETGRDWSALEQNIFSRLADSAGNLIHSKDLERSIQKQQEAILEAQQFSGIGTFEIDFLEQRSHFTENAASLLEMKMEEFQFDENLIRRLRRNVHEDDLTMIDQTWEKAMSTKSEVRLDFRLMKGNGEIKYLNWNLNPDFTPSGKIFRVRGTLQDITERVAIEQKAKTAQLIIENSPSVLFRWKIEENWPVEYVSSNISRFGYSTEQFLNQELKYASIIHPEDYNEILSEIERNKADGIRTYQQRYRIFDSLGKIRWVEDLTVCEYDDKGNEIYHQGIITDITDKMNAQAALEQSEERFRNLVQNSSDIITILSNKGEILYESPSFYRSFDYKETEIIGRSAFELVHPDDLEIVNQAFSKLLSGEEQSVTLVFRFQTKAGSYIYLESIGNNLLNQAGINGIVVNSRDVSERINSELQLKEYAGSLEKINKELDQFAYIVSHDLKAPLRAINNLSEWISEDLEDVMTDDTRKNLGLMKGRIGRMESLINGILEYSRAGRMKAESVPIPMHDFVQDIVYNLSPPEQFRVIVQDEMPVIEGEKVAIEQVFSNFISNAIKYNNNEQPEIKVGYADQGVEHCFFVEDNGPGIEPEFHEKVFAIFQTLQARDSVESTGVGLAIVKKIVEEKGGKVWLESEPGKGSKFLFTFPKLTKECE